MLFIIAAVVFAIAVVWKRNLVAAGLFFLAVAHVWNPTV